MEELRPCKSCKRSIGAWDIYCKYCGIKIYRTYNELTPEEKAAHDRRIDELINDMQKALQQQP